MPIGCAISYNLFEKFLTFLRWELQRQVGVGIVIYYLNDFLFLGSYGSDECACLMQGFQNQCEAIGDPIAQQKQLVPQPKLLLYFWVWKYTQLKWC